ncbi:hypothetical protein Pla86_14860 [Planctomycetes bacterium Pla86]|uniref:TIGR00266 family protein n=2 Tax=Engelhardtia mirabilis TaxID=2528011 RepID=A0A518BHI3_9BACT|nr:hypothetical protein Pla133_14870 [Planctomycetes bacterium Pla133]QDV00741.1 hypothetical protein Pla86_14860 [Planctomycetes bacterium Pla86]
MLEFDLEAGEHVVAEAGAMAWMDPCIDVLTSTRGGLLKALKRQVLAGESLFQNTYTARGAGSLTLAPGAAGDVIALPLDGELLLERGAYLAHAGEIDIDAKWGGFKGLLAEGLFLLHAQGRGDLFFDSYGRIEVLDVDGEVTVDNGFAVAWEPSLSYRLTRARKIRSFLFADQLLMRFSGRGRLWVQNRSTPGFANWVHPFRRVQSRKDGD